MAEPRPAADLAGLPAEFLEFLEANGVPPEAFRAAHGGGGCAAAAWRYVRVNPQGPLALRHPEAEPRARAVAEALGGADVRRVAWLDRAAAPWAEVYACAQAVSLSGTEAYKDGSLYGIDAASVFAVVCLEPQPGDAVLDLCCAPGVKLCAACDAVLPGGTAVGVDIAEPRLAACRAVVRRYRVANARLALGDGTTWAPEAASWFDLDPPRGRGQRGRKRKMEAKAREEAAAVAGGEAEDAGAGGQQAAPARYDRVLVDAECTHDASLRHLQKFGTQWGWGTLGGRVPWVRQEGGLFELQSALLANGFRLLREGGTLVYSTCSLCRRQNEDVVAALLAAEPAAALAPLPLPLRPGGPAGSGGAPPPDAEVVPARPSLLEAEGPRGPDGRYCTARFDPAVSGTSGLFVARLAKRAPADY